MGLRSEPRRRKMCTQRAARNYCNVAVRQTSRKDSGQIPVKSGRAHGWVFVCAVANMKLYNRHGPNRKSTQENPLEKGRTHGLALGIWYRGRLECCKEGKQNLDKPFSKFSKLKGDADDTRPAVEIITPYQKGAVAAKILLTDPSEKKTRFKLSEKVGRSFTPIEMEFSIA